MIEKALKGLERRGHKVGTQTGMSADGKILLSVDGSLRSYREICQMLESKSPTQTPQVHR
jgi:hypothetical protein